VRLLRQVTGYGFGFSIRCLHTDCNRSYRKTMSTILSDTHMAKIRALLIELIDQENACEVVAPNRRETGFWFGGGNPVMDADGMLWVAGRFRNYGDSRTGLAAGERGLECAIFCSKDSGKTFDKVCSWSKADLSFPENEVLSIEGTALHRKADGTWELFISSEKVRAYPEEVGSFLKPNCGVWSIDVISGRSPSELDADTIRCVLREDKQPAYIHIKDPVVFDNAAGETVMIFCNHPFCWSCSNSGYAVRAVGEEEFVLEEMEMVRRGATWDVACTRITDRMEIPRVGAFADLPPASVFFYDGAECVRDHDENAKAVSRPRGYSCEEIGSAFVGLDEQFPTMDRLSVLEPMFISPWGTGCNRYIHTCVTDAGIWVTWQRSEADLSQPLVGNFLSMERIADLLS
jgi:hypothetical protein